MKRGLNIDKKAFLTKQVNAIIQCKTPIKYLGEYQRHLYGQGTIGFGGQCQPATILSVQVAGFRGIKAYYHYLIFSR